MLLGISEIKKLIKDKKLVENYSDVTNNPVGCTIDLRLDKLFELKGEAFLGIEDRKTPEFIELASYKEGKIESYSIKPKQYVITKTIEEVNLPKNISAMFKPRSMLFRSGQILRTGIADPGYYGTLFFGLFNASESNFTIELGARFCSAQFYKISGDVDKVYDGRWQGGRDTAVRLEKQT